MADHVHRKKIFMLEPRQAWWGATYRSFTAGDPSQDSELWITDSLDDLKRRLKAESCQGIIVPFRPICNEDGVGLTREQLYTELATLMPDAHIEFSISFLEPQNGKDVIYQPFTNEAVRHFLNSCRRPKPAKPR